jgi:hypothetical protein
MHPWAGGLLLHGHGLEKREYAEFQEQLVVCEIFLREAHLAQRRHDGREHLSLGQS